MAQTPIKLITTTELESLLQTHRSQERLLELVHGEVVEKMPTEIHGKLAALIAYFFLTFIRNGNIAAHVGVEVRHEASDDPYNSRIPDVSIRLTNQPPMISGAVPMFPDLAVEIQSPRHTCQLTYNPMESLSSSGLGHTCCLFLALRKQHHMQQIPCQVDQTH